ncbi:MAG TPA: 30S ribosomal protein S4 [Candidatus Paceibacterota bacterium]|nr:30S ribosomal protein S4 [Parcubacteria group bacterium]HOM33249.1 30S ribosomal protein S4 [Candidatus Paceibacterota bacterium]HPC37433.1 30S ribosomal protein S4 [Candidatus Paceibacterota bacterium]HRU35906.1 30S ribosomal protein S4 [Candidatus Paceibacterota bacterium]
MVKLDSKCKKCRRAGEKLFLKGERCYGIKCALLRKPYAPGMHKKRKTKNTSEYGRQLEEVRKVKVTYGVNEAQMKKYFNESAKSKASTSDEFFKKLELRLDNIIFRLGFASSRREARQMVSHGHILVNGKKIDVPAYKLKKGDIITIRSQSLEKSAFKDLSKKLKKVQLPDYLTLNPEKLEAKVIGEPSLAKELPPFDFRQIVEFYSR